VSLRLPDALDRLWGPPVVVTAAHDGRANGLISTTAIAASLFAETPRVLVLLAKANLTHELALASGAFAVHLLPAEPAEPSLELVRRFGMRSGRDADKLAGLDHRTAVTGAPVLDAALAHAEARVRTTLDAGELTVVLGDVVDSASRGGAHLTNELLAELMPREWLDEWEARRERELAAARAFTDSGA
jgi:flavin reductase (DIM6/NTAB) family NADH-FMN oxidoreductase RutF